MTSETLTDFQQLCLQELERMLSAKGLYVKDLEFRPGYRALDDEGRVYVHFWVANRQIEIWVYTDGAEFSVPHRQRIFERPDYDSEEALMRAFIGGVKDYLSQPAAT